MTEIHADDAKNVELIEDIFLMNEEIKSAIECAYQYGRIRGRIEGAESFRKLHAEIGERMRAKAEPRAVVRTGDHMGLPIVAPVEQRGSGW